MPRVFVARGNGRWASPSMMPNRARNNTMECYEYLPRKYTQCGNTGRGRRGVDGGAKTGLPVPARRAARSIANVASNLFARHDAWSGVERRMMGVDILVIIYTKAAEAV